MKLSKDPWDCGYDLFRKSDIHFNPGLTVLVGCNGSGKTTLLRLIKEKLEKSKAPMIYFNNLEDGGESAKARAGLRQDFTFLATAMCSSEGENIMMNITDIAEKTGRLVKNNQEAAEIWILFDAIDSGFSVDNIIEVKEFLENVVIKENQNKSIYIIASANEYELCRDENCFDVYNGEYVTFKDYEDYRNFILESRKLKDKRG